VTLSDILQLRGWRAFFIGVAAFALIEASRRKFIPDLGNWSIVIAILGALSLALAAASGVEWLSGKVSAWKARREAASAIEDLRAQFVRDIATFSKSERDIFGYLRTRNQRTFFASIDGDLASTLLGRGYVQLSIRGKQQVDVTAAPFIVPEHIWEVIVSRPEDFPYEEPKDVGRRRRMPWHSPW
jgi:hypothetical protein